MVISAIGNPLRWFTADPLWRRSRCGATQLSGEYAAQARSLGWLFSTACFGGIVALLKRRRQGDGLGARIPFLRSQWRPPARRGHARDIRRLARPAERARPELARRDRLHGRGGQARLSPRPRRPPRARRRRHTGAGAALVSRRPARGAAGRP